jgi:WD40 repeat protein
MQPDSQAAWLMALAISGAFWLCLEYFCCLVPSQDPNFVPLTPFLRVCSHAGKVANGLKWHPDGDFIVFPLGSTVVLKNTRTQQQVFLHGHTDKVTCVAMSHCGRYLASGQRTEPGTKVG